MKIWRLIGNEIGPGGNGASHFATRKEAIKALHEFLELHGEDADWEIESILIKTREQLAQALDDAMGYGCS